MNNIHSEFGAFGTSAVNIANDIVVGRPYGGTAILCRLSLSHCIKFINTDDPRLCAAVLSTAVGPVFVVNLYMPMEK